MFYLDKEFIYRKDIDGEHKAEPFDGKYFDTRKEAFEYMEANEYRLADNEILTICEVEK